MSHGFWVLEQEQELESAVNKYFYLAAQRGNAEDAQKFLKLGANVDYVPEVSISFYISHGIVHRCL